MVNTVPPLHGGAAAAGALVSASQAASVFPDVSAHPMIMSAPSATILRTFGMLDNLVLDLASDKRSVCVSRRDVVAEAAFASTGPMMSRWPRIGAPRSRLCEAR